jgi:hypothetical protein
MTLFANTRDFRAALRDAILHASQTAPSRHALASQLEVIADKLGAKPRTRKKAPAKGAPAPVRPRELVNIAQGEARALEYFGIQLDEALRDLRREQDYVKDALDMLYQDAKDDEREVTKEEIETRWNASRGFADTIAENIKNGLDMLVSRLEDHAPITQEVELFEAVQAFFKKFPKDAGNWPEGKGEKLFKEVEEAITHAKTKMPSGLTKPSDLGRLREVLESIAEAMKLMTGKSFQVPKIPNALAPEDPRQLGFGFTASQRVASPADLKDRLEAIWRLASQRHPSRQELAEALYATAQAVRPRVAVKVDEKGSGDWTVYFETDSPKTIHRWKYPSKAKAHQVAVAEQKERGGYVTIMKGGIEQEEIGPS